MLAAAILVIALVVGVRWFVNWQPTVVAPATDGPPAPERPAARDVQPADVGPAVQATQRQEPAAAQQTPPRAEPPPRVGVHAFPPLGTRQLLSGIIVPEDFELPPGYVRHVQVTDAGERLPPILMFHPTVPPRDWRGEPIPVTSDRIVPPQYAPAGMPIEMLEAPRSGPAQPGNSWAPGR